MASGPPRPGLATRLWHWRDEAALIVGVLLGTIGIGATLGLGWLITAAAAALAVLAAALAWPSSRRRPGTSPRAARNHRGRGQADGLDPGEPILYAGYGHLWPFG